MFRFVLQSLAAEGAELPSLVHHPAATGTISFESVPAVRAAKINFLHESSTTRASFGCESARRGSPFQEPGSSAKQGQYEQSRNDPSAQKPTAAPAASAIHQQYPLLISGMPAATVIALTMSTPVPIVSAARQGKCGAGQQDQQQNSDKRFHGIHLLLWCCPDIGQGGCQLNAIRFNLLKTIDYSRREVFLCVIGWKGIGQLKGEGTTRVVKIFDSRGPRNSALRKVRTP